MKRIHAIGILIFACLLVTALTAAAGRAQTRTPVVAAFQTLQSLAGKWEGTDNKESAVKTSFELIAANTAVMETLSMSGMEQMVTLYSIDGEAISLVHYCPTNNEPRMRAMPSSGDIKGLVFSFVGAGNLPSFSTGHQHKLIMEFQDKNHITEHWTWRENGKDTEMIFHFTRASGQ